jgi:hypothetical protein
MQQYTFFLICWNVGWFIFTSVLEQPAAYIFTSVYEIMGRGEVTTAKDEWTRAKNERTRK